MMDEIDDNTIRVDALSHLSEIAFRKFCHLPTTHALLLGERLDKILCRIWKGHNQFFGDMEKL